MEDTEQKVQELTSQAYSALQMHELVTQILEEAEHSSDRDDEAVLRQSVNELFALTDATMKEALALQSTVTKNFEKALSNTITLLRLVQNDEASYREMLRDIITKMDRRAVDEGLSQSFDLN